MSKLEIFFDYACPYSQKGFEYITAFIDDYPQLELIWHPCEAHPRPDEHGYHSDLCIKGMFYALDKDIDLIPYHKRMFQAAVIDEANIENIDILAEYVKDILDPDEFKEILLNNKYGNIPYNDDAFIKNNICVLPSFRMNKSKLDAVEEIGVTKEQLEEFIQNNL